MGSGRSNEEGRELPLYETKRGRNGEIYRVIGVSVLVGIVLVWVYRALHIPIHGEDGRWGWIGAFAAELWFGSYWILTQSFRWNPVHRLTFKDRLSLRYGKALPAVDIFVCTADPTIEPPMMVVNTVLSVMAYNYPPEKLSVYLSDDGGSHITFYALLEASRFSEHWLPYCRKFHIQLTSPVAYFNSMLAPQQDNADQPPCFDSVKKLYEEMEDRVETAVKLGRISEEVRLMHKQFSQWDSFSSRRDHDTILQILIDGKNPEAADIEGYALPTLVYLAREKRPCHPHNFKAGALNALIRVSAKITNGPVILTVDCDMYSNNSNSVRDALCFFMDEGKGNDIAFVQFPQNFDNITKNELYSSSLRVISKVDFPGLDGVGGPMYIGTGCFHRRDALCGMKFSKELRSEWKSESDRKVNESASELQERLKVLADCSYEKNTQWGKEMGLKHGCPVEDVITGLFIQCQGWRSVYYDPERTAFLGIAPTTLPQTLMQHKRWSEGDLQILLSKYSPLWYGHGRISPLLRMGYCVYCLWAPNCFATLFYSVVPSLYLLKGIPLFPQMHCWFFKFAAIPLLAILLSLHCTVGVRFAIDREECFSHDVEYEGDTVHASFVVIKDDSSWHYSENGVDLVVKGPSGEQIHDSRDKTSDIFEFVTHERGLHRFCFTNKSPYHETIDFDVRAAHFSYHDEHAKDEHFKPLLEQISKLEEALYNIQFEQHWLEAQTEHQAIVNEGMNKRAVHKVIFESAALVGASVLQVYLLRRLFERKLGMSRV